MGGMPFDLSMDGLLSIFAASNPQIGPQLDAAGLPVPMGMSAEPLNESVGGMINPQQQQQQKALAALQGVVAPKPVTPIMQGGVSGGVKSPEVNAKGTSQGAPAIQALMQALLQRQSGPAVPSLGQMIQGAT